MRRSAPPIARSAAEIKVRDDGPYKVTGPVRLLDAEGAELAVVGAGETVVLCRCGASETKPFCDASHRGRVPLLRTRHELTLRPASRPA